MYIFAGFESCPSSGEMISSNSDYPMQNPCQSLDLTNTQIVKNSLAPVDCMEMDECEKLTCGQDVCRNILALSTEPLKLNFPVVPLQRDRGCSYTLFV